MPAAKPKVEIICAECGERFYVVPARARAGAKYCGKVCANLGQPKNRPAWNKGKTKADDPRMQSIADHVSRNYAENPTRGRGENHPMYGRKHSAESLAKMSAVHKGQPVTGNMNIGLAAGRRYFKGRTKETDPSVARRSAILSEKYKGRANPEHGERMRRYYQENPEKHPNRILAKKGHETRIERAMRLALTAEGIQIELQFPIARYFADFALTDFRIVVEVDGEHWHDAEKDAERDGAIARLGWRVIRFSEPQVLHHLSDCLIKLRALISTAAPDFLLPPETFALQYPLPL